jgi:hypothetical protein
MMCQVWSTFHSSLRRHRQRLPNLPEDLVQGLIQRIRESDLIAERHQTFFNRGKLVFPLDSTYTGSM